MLSFSPFILPFFIIGIYWGIFGRTHKRTGNDKDDRLEDNKATVYDFNTLRDELNWAAHEAEVANLRSEALMRRMLYLEGDVRKIKESIKMSLDVFFEINRKLGKLEEKLSPVEKHMQIRSRKERRAEDVMTSDDVKVGRLSDLEKQVLDLISSNGPMSARDLQAKIGKSREHISRLLGKLVDLEMVRRIRSGRQFTYDVLNHSLPKDDENKAGSIV